MSEVLNFTGAHREKRKQPVAQLAEARGSLARASFRNSIFTPLYGACLLAVLLSGSAFAQGQDAPAKELVLPSQANLGVKQFNEPNLILTPAHVSPNAPLVIYLPGTGGKPNFGPLIHEIVGQGFPTIYLMYDDEPTLSVPCPAKAAPACAGQFREMRSFGSGPASGPVQNPYEESIESRLSSLLLYLDKEHPNAGWHRYLTAQGKPEWSRILISGLSQGAGMAAYIAGKHKVYRVVLFSSPWDVNGPDKKPAPWMSEKLATPSERWWAERHVEESTTQQIANAYVALRIPPDHIMLFDKDLGLSPGKKPTGTNPYHASTVLNKAYAPQWHQLYGTAPR